jgi:release factor glutamine methyltransferase
METPEFPTKDFAEFFKDVYEPAEDTFLLLDALEQDLMHLRTMKPLICLEIGCGSGAVITALRNSLGPESLFFATDVDFRAGQCCLKCLESNGVFDSSVQIVQTDLLSSLEERLGGNIDLLIFNPPYVPTEDQEVIDSKEPIVKSWAGGKQGMQVTDRLLQKLPKLLSSRGKFYIVLLKENNIPNVMSELREFGIESRVVLERRCGIEYLFILSGNKLSS